ncbi:MAG: hypothetical protein GXP09_11060 [Gammaproteobacteria bacterium]|nr:hypothetical protein [Gammaproteobacteria bacterium]
MLTEIPSTINHSESSRRRWFSNANMDLFLWQGKADEVLGFQFCYDKNHQERMFSWFTDTGYQHCHIDDGEASPKRNMSPILLANANPYDQDLVSRFCANAVNIDPRIASCVAQHLDHFLELSKQLQTTRDTDQSPLP